MPDCDDIDVRLLGLLLVGGSLVGVSLMGGSLEGLDTPNDRRLTPDTYALEMAEPADMRIAFPATPQRNGIRYVNVSRWVMVYSRCAATSWARSRWRVGWRGQLGSCCLDSFFELLHLTYQPPNLIE